MKKVLLSVIVAGMVLGATGVAFAEETADKTYEVAYITPTLEHSFWIYMKTGVENEAQVLGNVNVTTYDSKGSASVQYSNVQDIIQKGVDGIVLTPTDSASAVAVLDLAEEAGIPVAISDIGADADNFLTYVKTNNYDGSKEAGEYLASLLNDGDQVAEIVGSLARQNQIDRKEGFEEGVMTKAVEIVDFKQMEVENRAEGETYGQDFLTAYPDLKAIFSGGGEDCLGVLSACQSAGRDDVILIGFDMTEELLDAIKEGTVAGACAQQPVLMGATALDSIMANLAGEEVEQIQQIDTILVTKDNVESTEALLRETAMVEIDE